MKKIINTPLNMIGFSLVKNYSGTSIPSWIDRIKHAKKLGFAPQVIVDGGAFTGIWSREAAQVFPMAQLIIVEPNPFLQDEIKKNVSEMQPKPTIRNVALGESQGSATLNVWREAVPDPGASLLDHVSGKAHQSIKVKVDTLDNILLQTGLVPDFVKLDLQGGELSALKGATQTLKSAELMMIEFGCLEAYEERTTPLDLLEIMYKNDYCLYDIVDCHYRPYDRALTGGDFLFVKNSSALRNYKGWE